jgi:hypothetical protein
MVVRRRLISVGVAVAALPWLAACGDAADQDFCTQYAELVAAADEVRELDPLTAKAEDVRDEAEDFQAQLDQFRAVSEGRFDAEISTLRASIDAIRQAALDKAEALESARPLLEDDLEDVRESWANLQQLADTQCENA